MLLGEGFTQKQMDKDKKDKQIDGKERWTDVETLIKACTFHIIIKI